jgi:hypothetical protein
MNYQPQIDDHFLLTTSSLRNKFKEHKALLVKGDFYHILFQKVMATGNFYMEDFCLLWGPYKKHQVSLSVIMVRRNSRPLADVVMSLSLFLMWSQHCSYKSIVTNSQVLGSISQWKFITLQSSIHNS